MSPICVIGAGRIGLPIAVSFASSGQNVKLLERDQNRVDEINLGRSPFEEPEMADILKECVLSGSLAATSDGGVMKSCETIICAVGTGLDEDMTPDLDGMTGIVNTLSDNISSGALLIFKTTLPVGTTEILSEKLSHATGFSLGSDLFVAFCPERIVEGKAMEELRSLPKIVGGIDEKSTHKAAKVMSLLGGRIIRVSDSRTAELCKLLDNAYRITRFGFAADVAEVSIKCGVDAYEAIRAANLDYERNSIPLPSVGVSGYCLTKDPYYLDSIDAKIWKERGFASTWITARRAADWQTSKCVDVVSSELGVIDDPVVVVAGITYKENVDDERLSHGREIGSILANRGIEVRYWDPQVSRTNVDGIKVGKTSSCLNGADCLIITVPHKEFVVWNENKEGIEKMRRKTIFDGWGLIDSIPGGGVLLGTGRGG